MKVMTFVGARPQFVKAAMVSRALRGSMDIREVLVHTGQHYDDELSGIFFRELGMTRPDFELKVGSKPRPEQLASIIETSAEVIADQAPDMVLVYGDTTSTLGASLAAGQLDVPVVHVEGGERIFRRRDVPEETNRVLVDHVAHLNLVSTRQAERHLLREGLARERVVFVGDVMYDLFLWGRKNLDKLQGQPLEALGLEPGGYHLATIHRAENISDRKLLERLLKTLDQSFLPVVLPLHPATAKALAGSSFEPSGSLQIIPPQGYATFLRLLLNCNRVVTDSGGVTREAFFAAKPSIIPMENSWWTDIVNSGWALPTGSDIARLAHALENYRPDEPYPQGLFGQGDASRRIASKLTAIKTRPEDGAWHGCGPLHRIQGRKPNGFSLPAYEQFLAKLAGEGYFFASFSEAKDLLQAGERFVLLRHDVDMDVSYAGKMAELEASLGVSSTYFIMVSGELYNPFAKRNAKAVERILEHGHRLGLHFDCARFDDGTSLSQACAREIGVLESFFNTTVNVVSFHRPGKEIFEHGDRITGGVMHTYQSLFQKDIRYFSDSRGGWHHGDPLLSDEFEAGRPLQLLVHPIWWTGRPPCSPHETLMRFVDDKLRWTKADLEANCTVFRLAEPDTRIQTWQSQDLPSPLQGASIQHVISSPGSQGAA